MLDVIAASLKRKFDGKLVDELLAAYLDAKRNFYLGGLRLSAVEGGRFCEAAFRMLEQVATGTFTSLNRQLRSDKLIADLEKLSAGNIADSIRVHIPRALRVVYDIRNRRDAAHLADGIDPNIQDASLVVANLDWVLAEFVRLSHTVSANEAQRIIDDLVVRRAPAVQDFSGFLKVLKPKLQVGDRVLLLLYERGAERATYEQLVSWVHPKMRRNLKRTLYQLEHDKAFIHSAGDVFQITMAGMQEVERRKLHDIRW